MTTGPAGRAERQEVATVLQATEHRPAHPVIPTVGVSRGLWSTRFRSYGHLILAAVGTLAFVIVTPPVADLQAADARAGAAARHVGLGYWLSWFGGSTPGQYSVLTPAVASVVGVTTLAALSVLLIAALARPLLVSSPRRNSAALLVVASALANLWCGRVPFSVAIAVSLVGLLLLQRNRPIAGGIVNGLATLFSPLAPAFILLIIMGPLLTRKDWRPALIRFAIPSVIGLVLPSLFFGAPAPMPFAWTTLAWSVGIVAAALFLDLPRHMKWGLWVAAVACVGAFFIPSGVGANISRYAFLLLPPLIWATSRNPRRIVALALLPAFAYSGYVVVRDISDASQPAAQQTYYEGLRAELSTIPGRDNQRVEVLDTTTHRAAAELIPTVYLARGWETQSDSSNNAIFYDQTLLNAASYRSWLLANAVGWVAVPTAPGDNYVTEAALIRTRLPYLAETWHDAEWTLYRVAAPTVIVPAPATVVQSTETEVVFSVPSAATLTLRLKPTKFVKVTDVNNPAAAICLSSTDPDEITAVLPAAGEYRLTSGFSVVGTVRHVAC